MASFPTIKVDSSKAFDLLTKYPAAVQNNLRTLIPALVIKIGNTVEQRLNTDLKTRRRLKVNKQLVERPNYIGGVIKVVWTGDDSKAMVPQWLDTGTKPHEIWARGARGLSGPKALSFFWAKQGRWFFGPMVNHPGFKGLNFVSQTLEQYEDEIIETYRRAKATPLNRRSAGPTR